MPQTGQIIALSRSPDLSKRSKSNHSAFRSSGSLRNLWDRLRGTPARPPILTEEDGHLTFHPSEPLTLGVEIELQILNPLTGAMMPSSADILGRTHNEPRIKPEIFKSMLEITTGICQDAHDAERDLKEALDIAQESARVSGAALSSTASHPIARHQDCEIAETDRYKLMIDRNQWIARRLAIFGLHVHIGMRDGDECIRFLNFFQRFVPHLLALSASSPFWQGEDTGLSSCRPTMFEAMPTAGQPYSVRNWHDFEYLTSSLRRCGSITSLKDLWWDLRPSPQYGTLELRICDAPATLAETSALTAFVHALALHFAEDNGLSDMVSSPPHWLSRENKWRAIRHGLEADILLGLDGQIRNLREDISLWLERLQPVVERMAYQPHMDMIRLLLERGTSTTRQRAIFARTGSLDEVARFNMRELEAGAPIWADEMN